MYIKPSTRTYHCKALALDFTVRVLPGSAIKDAISLYLSRPVECVGLHKETPTDGYWTFQVTCRDNTTYTVYASEVQ